MEINLNKFCPTPGAFSFFLHKVVPDIQDNPNKRSEDVFVVLSVNKNSFIITSLAKTLQSLRIKD